MSTLPSKQEIRASVKQRLSAMTADERATESAEVVRRLHEALGTESGTIVAFNPLPDEPDIAPLIAELSHQKNVICMPNTKDSDIRLDVPDIGVVLVPGRAFTKGGNRVGRGLGGYDKWIAAQRKRSPNTKYIGVCFNCQIVSKMPIEPHDEKMDMVITPSYP